MASEMERWLVWKSFRRGLDSAARLARLEDAKAAAKTLHGFAPNSFQARLAELFGTQSLAGGTARAAFRAAYAVHSRARVLTNFRHRWELRAVMREALEACGDGRAASGAERPPPYMRTIGQIPPSPIERGY